MRAYDLETKLRAVKDKYETRPLGADIQHLLFEMLAILIEHEADKAASDRIAQRRMA